jgi:hypothetical protein
VNVQRVHICYDDGSRGTSPTTAGAGGGRGESKKASKKVAGGSGSGSGSGNAARAAHEDLPSAHIDDDALPQERYVGGSIRSNRLFRGINWLFSGVEAYVRPRTDLGKEVLIGCLVVWRRM